MHFRIQGLMTKIFKRQTKTKAAITRDDVIDYLSSLGEAEAADLIFESLNHKRIEKKYENGDFQIDDAFTIATCTFGSSHGEIDEEAIIEIYAKPSDPNIKPNKKSKLSEQGACSLCKANLISYEKWVTCPICGTKNDLT